MEQAHATARWMRWPSIAAAVAVFGLCLVAAPSVNHAGADTTTPLPNNTGFSEPFLGTPQYAYVAPTELTDPSQLNQPIGPVVAARIAHEIGLTTSFTRDQFQEFISGGGQGGDPHSAALVDQSVRILTNTVGHPLYSLVAGQLTPTVLASYGLFVTKNGWLESPANLTAPTRRVNKVIAPGGYMNQWCFQNGAVAALKSLYQSAYTAETLYGYVAQQISSAAQLAPNSNGTGTVVGMSMAPALWIVNFALIWTLKPALAAWMPAQWTPVPAAVATALDKSRFGRVRYARYASYLPQ